jgi:hypothetical protein
MPHTSISVGEELEFDMTLVTVEAGVLDFHEADLRIAHGNPGSNPAVPTTEQTTPSYCLPLEMHIDLVRRYLRLRHCHVKAHL